MMAGVEYPEIIFAGLLYHELGHAYEFLIEKSPSSVASAQTFEYCEEEVGMHELESIIFDQGSNGEYFKIIDEIVNRTGRGKDAKEAIFNITHVDLNHLNEVLGCAQVGTDVAGVIIINHLLITGFRYIDLHIEKNKLQEKVNLYYWLRFNAQL